MYQIEINSEGQIETIKSEGSQLLLSVLREAGYALYAPCGGNGTCGKCKVWIQGEGAVTSCFYPVTQNLSIRLPDQRESQILVDQHQHTQKLPFNPGNDLSPYPYGVAIDIGTTTLVFYLVDLITGVISETRAIPNPQSIFGSDVISRINHTAINENGLDELQQILLDSINDQFEHFINFIGISQDDIVKVTIAGNTTMLHFLLGKDPLSIALPPFTPKFIESQIIKT